MSRSGTKLLRKRATARWLVSTTRTRASQRVGVHSSTVGAAQSCMPQQPRTNGEAVPPRMKSTSCVAMPARLSASACDALRPSNPGALFTIITAGSRSPLAAGTCSSPRPPRLARTRSRPRGAPARPRRCPGRRPRLSQAVRAPLRPNTAAYASRFARKTAASGPEGDYRARTHLTYPMSHARKEKEPAKVASSLSSLVAKGGIEPPTQGFSVLCSTN